MTSFDMAVAGGGVIGLGVALEAARRGARVVLVSDDGPRASAAAAGMLCPSFEALHFGGRALLKLGTDSLALWDGFAASLAEDPARDLDYRRDGVIALGFPPRALPGEPCTVPDGVEASRALLVPGEGQVDPRRLLPALERACEAAGMERRAGRVSGLVGDAEQAQGVVLEGGESLRAATVVLATGAAPREEAEMVPLRGRALAVAGLPVMPERTLRSPGVYLCPKADGTLYVGATEEERDMPAALDGVWHEASWLMPSLTKGRIVRRFDGVRPGTRDGLPIVRRSSRKKALILALGHHRNGVLLAPLTAKRVADLAGF
ncbi:NAD(P)/FAD-dependent oxidoreductase [Parvularcula dongshanensis]|uniref:Glycine oxidase n=1 Tax=Parvularcula dongshanensis TaxID=1173995 RepID=A0A840I0Y3_9PROT|nr:FAD-dependent oxidoreductase [Parvularcula dongshanensis]MBB4657760.1 glycine oxidase [Parvularcula dongshanensis]